MRLLILCAMVTFFVSAVTCFAEDSLTCGTNLVSVGDSKPAILGKCGAPSTKKDIGGDGTRERWTYIIGGDFPKILTFDGDRLESIEDGDRGL